MTASLLAFGLTACTGSAAPESTPETKPEETPVAENTETPVPEEPSKTLVIYFSATGTTKDIAEKIASVTDADLFEIKAAEEYTDADLNWHDDSCRANKEQQDQSVRPEIANDTVSLEGYTTVYIGFPIWWGEQPRIIDTFVEAHDFSGITMIPFCTSGSSPIGNSGKNLEAHAGSGTWKEGRRFAANTPENEISAWIDSMK